MERIYDMIIMGGGPAGYTAALYAARAGLDTLIIERMSVGGQMAITDVIDNYPGFEEGIDGFSLADKIQKQAERFGAQSKSADVVRVDLKADPKVIETSSGTFFGRTIIISTGANPRELGVAKESELVGRGVSYCAVCDGAFFKGKTTCVIGGGSTALADALLLSELCEKVYLIHRRDEFRGEAHVVDRLKEKANVECILSSTPTEFIGEDSLSAVRLKNVISGEETIIDCNGAFVAVGQAPDMDTFAELIELNGGGYAQSGENCLTVTPGVFVAGDCREKSIRQLTTAVSDGTVAALAACDYVDSL
jgi:thioredoxin reductase (NADPH)